MIRSNSCGSVRTVSCEGLIRSSIPLASATGMLALAFVVYGDIWRTVVSQLETEVTERQRHDRARSGGDVRRTDVGELAAAVVKISPEVVLDQIQRTVAVDVA